MTYLFKLARRAARLRALPFVALASALAACDTDRLTSISDEPAPVENTDPRTMSGAPSFSSGFRGGIPFGTFHLPREEYGTIYNGSLGVIFPQYVLGYLEAARQSGTKIMLALSGSEDHFKNSNRSFNMEKWQERIDRYRGIDFSSYIEDGTIIGHYLIDEPNDPANWGGRTISPETVEEMAQYSKRLWPSMPTLVRTPPAYLKGRQYRYLDAAWAQYLNRKGRVADFIRDNVAAAQAAGLALVVGINLLDGGSSEGLSGFYRGGKSPNASELEAWGSVLLDHPYPCAFISWKHHEEYLGRSDIKSAMEKLSRKAREHPNKSCRPGSQASEPDDDGSPPDDSEYNEQPGSDDGEQPGSDDDGEPGSDGGVTPSSIDLTVTGWMKQRRQHMTLLWSGAAGRDLDVYRNGVLIKNTANDGRYTNSRSRAGSLRGATYEYKVCETGTSNCSSAASVTFR